MKPKLTQLCFVKQLSLTKGEDPNQAEMLYVRALHLAIQQNDHNAVAYVQDLLANLALQNGQLDKVAEFL